MRLEPVAGHHGAQHLPDRDGETPAFELPLAEAAAFEQLPDGSEHGPIDDHGARVRHHLQAGREAGQLAGHVEAPMPTISPTTTSPAEMPTRAASLRPSGSVTAVTASTIARAARTARSVSSSFALG